MFGQVLIDDVFVLFKRRAWVAKVSGKYLLLNLCITSHDYWLKERYWMLYVHVVKCLHSFKPSPISENELMTSTSMTSGTNEEGGGLIRPVPNRIELLP